MAVVNGEPGFTQLKKVNVLDEFLLNGQTVAESIDIDRVLDGESLATEQEPTGTGVAGATQIEFGPAVNTSADPVNLLADGTVQVNQTGLYRIKVAAQFGRDDTTGTARLLFRVLINGVQAGRSVNFNIINARSTDYFENDTWITLPQGTELTFEVMRDSSGADNGGLFSFTPTPDGGNEWNFSPSAAIRIERWNQTPS